MEGNGREKQIEKGWSHQSWNDLSLSLDAQEKIVWRIDSEVVESTKQRIISKKDGVLPLKNSVKFHYLELKVIDSN